MNKGVRDAALARSMCHCSPSCALLSAADLLTLKKVDRVTEAPENEAARQSISDVLIQRSAYFAVCEANIQCFFFSFSVDVQLVTNRASLIMQLSLVYMLY